MLFFQIGLYAQSEKITIEAASEDPTLVPRGKELLIDEYSGSEVKTKVFLMTIHKPISQPIMGVVVDANFAVIKKIENQIFDTKSIEKGQFLVATLSKTNSKAETFLATQFRIGDVVKLRKDGNLCTLADVLALNLPQISLQTDKFLTQSKSNLFIKGTLKNANKSKKYKIEISGKEKQTVKSDFSFPYQLKIGVNYIDVSLWENNVKISEQSIVAFLKENKEEVKKKVLWIEQFPNAKVLTNKLAIDSILVHAKNAGFNSVAFDVKGPEGYVSYRKNNLSQTPYFTSTINPNKKIVDDGFDLLQALIDGTKKHGLKIYVSFNFFTEGNLTAQDFAILKQHPDWEEIVQRPEDKGALLKVSESAIGLEAKAGKRIALAFVNPSNKQVCDFQLLRVKEVLQNYRIDGIVLDRTRYDNMYADFSELTRTAFESYLAGKGKKLTAFPADAFLIDKDGKLQEGQYFIDWITFRSKTISEFARSVRAVVDESNKTNNTKVELAAYVGSWYEIYYQNGVNWASRNFKYNSRLGFPETRIYSEAYSETSYTDILDFLMIGTYYKTDKEIAKYVTLGNILTNGELPLVASISLPDLKNEDRPAVFKSAMETSSGLMIFDLSYIKWNEFLEQIKPSK